MSLALRVLWLASLVSCVAYGDSFDLRQVQGQSLVPSTHLLVSGTCWSSTAVSAMESNLLVTGKWHVTAFEALPRFSEAHLQWWNGFNRHNNDDAQPAQGHGLDPDAGGDFRMVQAYIARGEGMVTREPGILDFGAIPPRSDPRALRWYVRDIVWYTLDPNLAGIDSIKQALQRHGALSAGLCMDSRFYDPGTQSHFQPVEDAQDPNHAVLLVGWDDQCVTQAPQPGAWLCRHNGLLARGDLGYFWVSYYDKHCARHPDLGAVSFQGVEPLIYARIYAHDYHGWRATGTEWRTACNAFTAQADEILTAVSFVTAADEVDYVVKVFDAFGDGQLRYELSHRAGHISHRGFHTVNLTWPVALRERDDFYVVLYLSQGGHAYDRTSEPSIRLGASAGAGDAQSPDAQTPGTVVSASRPGQSYYRDASGWHDLHAFDPSANFCIKALALAPGSLVLDAVQRVSHGQYKIFQQDIENMGLGRYAGPDFDQGFRNRDGWAEGGTLGNEEARLYLQDHFRALGLGVTVQGPYANVVAEQPGRSRPDDIYIVCGHYDTTSHGERPGGDDNASGTAGVLEAARVLTQYDCEATLRFIGFNAEEEWMKGSQDYVDQVVVPLQENVRGVINLDMILRPAWDRYAWESADADIATAATARCLDWARVFVDTAHAYVPALLIDHRVPQTTDWNASDQAPFLSAGYAAILVSENTAQEIWSRLSNAYYHTAEDASDALANDALSPSGVTYDYHFAVDIVRTTVAVLAEQAGLLPRWSR